MSHQKQSLFFPETDADRVWEKNDTIKRYYLNFPLYPFRTLNPRELNILATTQSGATSVASKLFDFDCTSPIFPAHTQMNLVFKKRKPTNFLSSMLLSQLDAAKGNNSETLTDNEKAEASSFTVVTMGPPIARDKFVITKVEIQVQDLYLQVRVIFLKKLKI